MRAKEQPLSKIREEDFKKVDAVNLLVLLREPRHLEFFFSRIGDCDLRDILLFFIARSRETFVWEQLKYTGHLEALRFFLGD